MNDASKDVRKKDIRKNDVRKEDKRKNRKKTTGKQSGHEVVREMEFPQVTGKIISAVKFFSNGLDSSIAIDFTDFTALIFDCSPEIRSTMQADYSDWKTGLARKSKRWGSVSQWNGL